MEQPLGAFVSAVWVDSGGPDLARQVLSRFYSYEHLIYIGLR